MATAASLFGGGGAASSENEEGGKMPQHEFGEFAGFGHENPQN